MLWSVPKCQLAPGWFRCECQRVQGCALKVRPSHLAVVGKGGRLHGEWDEEEYIHPL